MGSQQAGIAIDGLSIDRRSPLPMYEQISEQFRVAIRSRQFPQGTMIPTNRAIQDRLNVTYKTVHQAMEQLANEGFVERYRGKGTFVKGVPKLGLVGIYCHTVLLSADVPGIFVRRGMALASDFFDSQQRNYRLYLGGELSRFSTNSAVTDLTDDISRRGIVGLLLLNSDPLLQPMLDLAKTNQVPVVNMSDVGKAPYTVSFDLYGFINNAIGHLAQRGRQRTAVIFSSRRSQISSADGIVAYQRSQGNKIMPVSLHDDKASIEGGYHAAASLQLEQLDSLVVADDVMAQGVERYLIEKGVVVPEQLMVVTHWNKDNIQSLTLDFTKFELDTDNMIQQALNLLDDAISGHRIEQPHIHVLPKCNNTNPS